MDEDAEKTQLENKRDFIAAWLSHPITVEMLRDNEEQQQALISLICNEPIQGDPTLYALVEAKGHLRGLRRAKGIVQDSLDEVEQQLKELESIQ